MMHSTAAMLSLLFGALCLQRILARSINGYGNNQVFQQSELVAIDGTVEESFRESLYSQIINSASFSIKFGGSVTDVDIINVGRNIATGIASELNLQDYDSVSNFMISALGSVYPVGKLEDYASIIVEAVLELLSTYNILNEYNYFDLSLRIGNIIDSTLSLYVFGNGFGNAYGGNVDVGAAVGAGTGLGLDLGAGLGLGFDVGAGLGLGLDVGTGLGLGVGAGIGQRAGIGLGVNAGADVGVGANLGIGIRGEPAANTQIDTVDVSVDLLGIIPVFQEKLSKLILRNKYFRSIFSDSIPPTAFSSVSSVISQFLAKAFRIPRSYLIPLEKHLTVLGQTDGVSVELYAGKLASTLGNILFAANKLSPRIIDLQVSIASKAAASAVENFLSTYTIPGIGLSANGNPYNSYFSALNGLEILPYVGTDALSRKLPTALKAARASIFGTKFTKALYLNLISAGGFYESLQFPSSHKAAAVTLGKYVAEAFGSSDSSVFIDAYSKALSYLKKSWNHRNSARILAQATAEALYALGYFVSGDPIVQASIAANAITKAMSGSPIHILKGAIRTASLMTPLDGVPDIDVETDLGVDADLNLISGADLGLNIGANVGINADVNLDTEVGAEITGNLNGDRRLGRKRRALSDNYDIDNFLRLAAGLGVDARADVDVEAGIGVAANADVDVGVELDAGVGLKSGLGIGVGTSIDANNFPLSVDNILPVLLAEKLRLSTAVNTAVTLVGTQRVVDLIAQSIAAQFGFEVASAFIDTYSNSAVDTFDTTFGPNILPLAKATTDALAKAGILTDNFTLLTVDQLAAAVVAKYSSLIATSLEAKDWSNTERLPYFYDSDFIQPPLSPGYAYFGPYVYGKGLYDNGERFYGYGEGLYGEGFYDNGDGHYGYGPGLYTGERFYGYGPGFYNGERFYGYGKKLYDTYETLTKGHSYVSADSVAHENRAINF
ncbi:hypothetical protein X975_06812, partial [Stegodyphus mimosarum]